MSDKTRLAAAGGAIVRNYREHETHDTVRAAIDAARAAQGGA